MALIDIKNYLRQHGQASLTDLSHHFRAEPGAVRAMLEHWQRKGKVVQVQAVSACGKTCAGCCSAPAPEIYRWQEAGVDLPISVHPSG
jgi:hypothetical protein